MHKKICSKIIMAFFPDSRNTLKWIILFGCKILNKKKNSSLYSSSNIVFLNISPSTRLYMSYFLGSLMCFLDNWKLYEILQNYSLHQLLWREKNIFCHYWINLYNIDADWQVHNIFINLAYFVTKSLTWECPMASNFFRT